MAQVSNLVEVLGYAILTNCEMASTGQMTVRIPATGLKAELLVTGLAAFADSLIAFASEFGKL